MMLYHDVHHRQILILVCVSVHVRECVCVRLYVFQVYGNITRHHESHIPYIYIRVVLHRRHCVRACVRAYIYILLIKHYTGYPRLSKAFHCRIGNYDTKYITYMYAWMDGCTYARIFFYSVRLSSIDSKWLDHMYSEKRQIKFLIEKNKPSYQ